MANQHLHPLKQFNLKLLQVTIAIYIYLQTSLHRKIAFNGLVDVTLQ